jgi:SNF2 family DNA or RNA helicase
MGTLLASMIQHDLGVAPLFLHGGTPQPDREKMVDLFQERDGRHPVFVLSLKAGGIGLNLTAANHVFHFDRWWNPAIENQATDRAFRIGQTRAVQVHKFVCSGTLEERIDQMLEQKLELAENVIGSGEQWLTELSTETLRDLLSLRHDEIADEDEPDDEEHEVASSERAHEVVTTTAND